MKFPFYVGKRTRQEDKLPAKLPISQRSQLLNPENYIPEPGLRDACNVALLLGQPLLLTGEPGTGKTQFAYHLAWELGFSTPLKFETKSTSTARDLFYTYDTLKRFQDIQNPSTLINPLDYINYQALGLAILRTREPSQINQYLPPELLHKEKVRSVVLIDEIDKAPRDFCNDVLNELEHIYFRVLELGNEKIEADPELQPIVIITSNSEKDLPEPFLRRCIYYNLPFPDKKSLQDIIANHLGTYVGNSNTFLQTALDLFYSLRAPQSGLRKKPATAELLNWLITLQNFTSDTNNPFNEPDKMLRTLSTLIKTAEDQQKATKIVEQWIQKTKTSQIG